MSLPRPSTSPAVPWEFPTPEEHVLDNGLTVLLYPVPGQHVTATRVAIPAPLAEEPREREGVATLVSRTMDEGTERRSGDEMAEALERNGVGLGAGANEGGLTLEIDATTPRLDAGLDLLTECLTLPTFDEREVIRHRRQRLVEIEHALSRPGSRAAVEWVATRYADTDRASRPSGGAADTVAEVVREDCAAFHREHVSPSGATVVVAGDFAASDVLRSVERTLGSWTAPAVDASLDPAAQQAYDLAPDRGRIVFVDRPGAVQTELYLGASGPGRRADRGWATYRALAYVLGGAPQARIDALLREEKGYTYGIRAAFRPRLRGGEVVVSGSVRGEATAEALGLLHELFETAAVEGFTTEETRSAADFIGKTAPARYATADVIADEAALLSFDDLRTDFVTAYLADLRALTPSRLQEAWAAVVSDAWTIVLVGDAQAHAEAVGSLGLGDVTVV